jgi:tetratricopeptide (TPR) repeat protein
MLFPNDLIQRIRAGRCVLWAGGRLGSVAGAPGWRELADELTATLERAGDSRAGDLRRLIADGKTATVLGYARRALGAAAIREAATRLVATPGEIGDPLKALLALPWAAVVATGPGDLGQGERALTWADVDALAREDSGRPTLRLLGDPAKTDLLVTPAEFRDKVLAVAPLREHLEDLFRRKSFVLLGMGPDDPDFLFARVLLYGFSGTRVDHWARIEGLSEVEAEDLCAGLRAHALPGDGSLGDALLRLLADLAEAPAVELPPEEDLPAPDDLEGWLKYLGANPHSGAAREALATLEARFREWRDWDKVVLLLLGKLDATTEAHGRVELLREVARLFEHEVGDLGKAFHTLRAAFREDPLHADLATDLERLAGATGQWSELLRDYTEQALTRQDKEIALSEWMRIARLAGREANQPESAVEALRHVLRLDPAHGDAGRELRHALRQAKRWAELAEALVSQADAQPPLEGAGTLLQAADLYESRVGDMDQAAECYRRVLAADRRNRAAQTALARIYRHRELWEPLVKVLESKLETVEGEEVLETRREIADLLADKLEDPEGAIAQHKKIRELQPSDLRALRALEQLYDKAGKTESYLEVLEKLSEVVENDAERVSLRMRMAAELEEIKGGRARAIPHLQRAVAFDPTHLEAHRTLIRLLRDERRFAELRTELGRRLPFTTEDPERLALHVQIARISEEEMHDPEAARASWEKVLEADPRHRDARVALLRLYLGKRDHATAVQMLERALQAGLSDSERVEVHEHLGALFREQIHDMEAAERHFAKALEFDPRSMSSRLGLIEMYRARGDSLRAALLLCEAEQQTQNRIERVRYLVEAAELYAAAADPDRAREILRRALEVDPEHFEAASRLVDLLDGQGAEKEQFGLLELVLRKTDAQDRAGRTRIHVRIARLAKSLGNTERALSALRAAHDLDPIAAETLRELAPLLMAQEVWDEAGRLMQAMLAHHGDQLSRSERVALYTNLGTCIQRQGDESRAVHFFEKALDIEPEHQEAMRALVDIHARRSDPSALLRMKRALVRVAPQEERYRLWLEIGDLAKHLGQHAEASQAYQSAVTSRPGTGGPLHRLLELATASQNWQEAVDILDKLAEVESDADGRATVRYSAGVILRDHMRMEDQALARFEGALIDNPAHPKALQAMDRILHARGDWHRVADTYRRALGRMDKDRFGPARAALWHALGDVYREHLQDPGAAIDAYEEANHIEGPSPARQDHLVRLYLDAGPDRMDRAIASVQDQLRLDPGKLVAYRQLADLYAKAGKTDRAFCLAAALRLLGTAQPADSERYDRHRAKDVPSIKARLGGEPWLQIRHPNQDARLARAFAALAEAAEGMAARSPRSLRLDARRRVDLQSDERRFFKLIRDAAPVLEVGLPLVWERADLVWPRLASVRDGQAARAALLVGPALLDGRLAIEIAFAAVKCLAYLRPEHRLVWSVPLLGAQRTLVCAAIRIVAPKAPLPGDVAELDRVVGELRRRLDPGALRAIESIPDLPSLAEADLGRYAAAVDLTCGRVAAVLCGDLITAAKVVANEPPTAGGRGARDKVRDLVAFYVSSEHFASREHLGLAVS